MLHTNYMPRQRMQSNVEITKFKYRTEKKNHKQLSHITGGWMHLHLFFTTSIGSEEEYTHRVLALIETKGRGEWMWMGVCIEAFRLLFVWFEVYTYVSIWLIQIHWHICIQKVFGVSRRFSTGSRGTRNMFPLFFL